MRLGFDRVADLIELRGVELAEADQRLVDLRGVERRRERGLKGGTILFVDLLQRCLDRGEVGFDAATLVRGEVVVASRSERSGDDRGEFLGGP